MLCTTGLYIYVGTAKQVVKINNRTRERMRSVDGSQSTLNENNSRTKDNVKNNTTRKSE